MRQQRVTRRFASFIAGMTALTAVAAVAQDSAPADADMMANSATQLGLPAEFVVFGQRDPNIRTPTAIVNGDIITRTDVEHRLALVLASNSTVTSQGDELEIYRMQILRNLIDETLQIQEAEANEINIADAEVDQTFRQVAGNFNTDADQFESTLRGLGSSERSIKRQIEGELAWNRLLRRYVNPRVEVSAAEVQAVADALQASAGQTEYHVYEIFLSATPQNQQEIYANANRLVNQIREGAAFPAIARTYSEASTRAVGGDVGWIRPEQLPQELGQALSDMPVGAVSAPIPIQGGFSIIALVDQRQILVADPRDAQLSLKQITITFPEGTPEPQAQARVTQLAQASQQGGGCGGADAVASAVGGDVVTNDEVLLRDLPPALQSAMANLQIGQATQPFGSIEGGVRVLVLCGRDAPPSAAAEADPTEIEERMREERVNRQARSYLRDLRRNAVVEYR